MGQSSARPDNLKDFKTRTVPLDTSIESQRTTLASKLSSFTAENDWGSIDATGLVANVGQFVTLNRADATWVDGVGTAFREADASGSVAYATDAEIASSLQAQGIPSTGRADIVVDPSVATGGQQTTGYANDPVSAASGNFIEVEIDLGFGPTLADLQVRRTHNSLDPTHGPFGRGWSSWASCRLTPDTAGDWADWHGPDGQTGRIDLDEGTCPGFEGHISLDPATGGLVADFPREAMVWRFDPSGRPTETNRGPGTGIRFGWDGQRLTSITHVRGRHVTFDWDGDRIVAATADDGRRVTYSYDDNHHLVAVDGPLGARRYDVDQAGLILSVTDGDGVIAATNTYDEQGRVLTQRTEFGRLVRYHYEDNLVTIVDDDDAGPVNRYEHDRYGRLLKVVDGHGRAITRDYDSRGRVTAVKDRNGATTRYEWDDHDRQTAIIDPDGVRTETTYDDHHRPTAVTRGPVVTRFTYTAEERTPTEVVDPEGAVTRYDIVDGLIRRATDPDGVAITLDHDDQGRLTTATDAFGGSRRYEWDAAGQIVAITTPNGNRTSFERGAAGQVVARTTPAGATWRYEQSAAGRMIGAIDPLGHRRTYTRGEHGRVVAEIDEAGGVDTARFDTFGNVVARVLADGLKWEYSYDSLMRVVGITDPSGGSWLREHDAEGNLTGTITPEGVHRSVLVDGTGRTIEIHDGTTSARFEYDELGRPVAQIRPDGTRAEGTYDRAGRLVSLTEPTGGVSLFHYSPAGRLIGLTGPEGGRVHYSYDEAGRLVAVTDASGATRRLRLDADGQVVELIEPTGERTAYRYDADGRIVEVTAANGGVHRYVYDQAGRTLAAIDPTGATTEFGYDAIGRVVQVTDPNGGLTRLDRDLNGRVISETDPLGATTRYRYDEMGRILERTDPLGRRMAMTYDPSGRLIRRLDPDGRRWRWTYDASDRLRSWSVDGEFEVRIDRDLLGRDVRISDDRGATVERTWNRDGLLVREATTTPAGTVELRWRYDTAGRRIAWSVGGRETTVELDAAGRSRRVVDPAAGPLEIARDGAGRVSSLRYGDRTEQRIWANGALAGWSQASPAGERRTTLERDTVGRITAIATADPSGTARRDEARYDAAGQLIALEGASGARSFAYDAAGRLVAETGPSHASSYTYDAAGQLQRIERPDGAVDLTWDAAGRRSVEEGPDRVRRYGYDGLGRLAEIATTDAGGQTSTRTLTHDPLDRLAAVDGTPLAWDTVNPFSVLRAVGDHHLFGGSSPLGVIGPDDDVNWLDQDHRGSVGELDPFGAAGGEPVGTPGRPLLPGGLDLGLTGELAVDDQVWLRARMYDPGTRAFLSPDPLPGELGLPCATNPYHFCANDPLNQMDPSGLRPLTEAELDKIRTDWHKNAWDRYGNYVIAGAMIVGGIAFMATGFGGPIGAAMIGGALLGGGISAGTQQYTTGGVDWKKVGVDMVIGAAGGGAGAWAGAAFRTTTMVAKLGPIGRGAVVGTGENVVGGMASRAVAGENPFDPTGLALDVVTGGVIGGAGGRLGGRSQSLEQVEAARVNANLPQGQGSLWDMEARARGRVFEDAWGGNLNGNYPVIDDFNRATGAATSLKSMDPTLPSYARDTDMTRTLNGHVDNVAGFNGHGPHAGNPLIGPADVQSRHLVVGVPEGTAATRGSVLDSVRQHGQNQGVDVRFPEVGGPS